MPRSKDTRAGSYHQAAVLAPHHQHHNNNNYNSRQPMNGANINNKSRDADCCSVKFVKNVLHIFNIIFFVSKDFNQSVHPILYVSVQVVSGIFHYTDLCLCKAVESLTIPWDHEERDFIFHQPNDGQEHDEVPAHVPDNKLGWRRPSIRTPIVSAIDLLPLPLRQGARPN